MTIIWLAPEFQTVDLVQLGDLFSSGGEKPEQPDGPPVRSFIPLIKYCKIAVKIAAT